MYLMYFPANCCWRFCFGGPAISDLIPTSMDGRDFFRTRKEAVCAARVVGLQVDRTGYVTLRQDAYSFA